MTIVLEFSGILYECQAAAIALCRVESLGMEAVVGLKPEWPD
jgi:hypothetical protein